MLATETTFYISGLSCGGCIEKSQKSLQNVVGYESSEFDLEAGIMTIKGDVDPQAVSAAMAEAGYGAVVKSA